MHEDCSLSVLLIVHEPSSLNRKLAVLHLCFLEYQVVLRLRIIAHSVNMGWCLELFLKHVLTLVMLRLLVSLLMINVMAIDFFRRGTILDLLYLLVSFRTVPVFLVWIHSIKIWLLRVIMHHTWLVWQLKLIDLCHNLLLRLLHQIKFSLVWKFRQMLIIFVWFTSCVFLYSLNALNIFI